MIAIMWHAERAQWSAQCTITNTSPTSAQRVSHKITAESMHASVCNASSALIHEYWCRCFFARLFCFLLDVFFCVFANIMIVAPKQPKRSCVVLRAENKIIHFFLLVCLKSQRIKLSREWESVGSVSARFDPTRQATKIGMVNGFQRGSCTTQTNRIRVSLLV